MSTPGDAAAIRPDGTVLGFDVGARRIGVAVGTVVPWPATVPVGDGVAEDGVSVADGAGVGVTGPAEGLSVGCPGVSDGTNNACCDP